MKKILSIALVTASILGGSAQERVEPLPFGNMNSWVSREIKESLIIGGNTVNVYAIGPDTTIVGNKAYFNLGGSPWASSNVMAKVSGITKTNVSVFPDKHDNGYAARLDTHMASVKVLGVVNITVLAAGSIFLGEVEEPIGSPKHAEKQLSFGIPFNKKPKAVVYDYKVKAAEEDYRIKATGFSKIKRVEGRDHPEMNLYLQKRWEDNEGNIYALRIGTVVVRYTESTDWNYGQQYDILYGDISSIPGYDPEVMGLNIQKRYAKNSRGESKLINEVGWGKETDIPTHLSLQFASSHGGAFIGAPGTSLWIDNVGLVY